MVLLHTHAQSDAHETMVEETSVDVADVNERSQTGTATTIPAMSSSPTTDKTHKGNDAAAFKSRFQLFLLSLMVCQNTATVLMFRYLRFTVPPAHRFHISHFIFVVEVSKVRVSECMCLSVCVYWFVTETETETHTERERAKSEEMGLVHQDSKKKPRLLCLPRHRVIVILTCFVQSLRTLLLLQLLLRLLLPPPHHNTTARHSSSCHVCWNTLRRRNMPVVSLGVSMT